LLLWADSLSEAEISRIIGTNEALSILPSADAGIQASSYYVSRLHYEEIRRAGA
jgi:hypothetical protein